MVCVNWNWSHEIEKLGNINKNFIDIGGLENIIDELRESVLYPLTV